MNYEFRTASGEICCLSDNPNHLCKACKEKLAASRVQSPSTGGAARAVMPSASGVPPPPDLTDAIRRKRAARVLMPGHPGGTRAPRLTAAKRVAEIRKYFAVRQPMANGERP
jgi:hypothetical protein